MPSSLIEAQLPNLGCYVLKIPQKLLVNAKFILLLNTSNIGNYAVSKVYYAR